MSIMPKADSLEVHFLKMRVRRLEEDLKFSQQEKDSLRKTQEEQYSNYVVEREAKDDYKALLTRMAEFILKEGLQSCDMACNFRRTCGCGSLERNQEAVRLTQMAWDRGLVDRYLDIDRD